MTPLIDRVLRATSKTKTYPYVEIKTIYNGPHVDWDKRYKCIGFVYLGPNQLVKSFQANHGEAHIAEIYVRNLIRQAYKEKFTSSRAPKVIKRYEEPLGKLVDDDV